jgi:hypothetical protein
MSTHTQPSSKTGVTRVTRVTANANRLNLLYFFRVTPRPPQRYTERNDTKSCNENPPPSALWAVASSYVHRCDCPPIPGRRGAQHAH